jgi:isopentenyl diphosphate isomerase/L-lactate dehydrogenase-like FMN-dependent dehydrogenase
MPVIVAPSAFHALLHPDAEPATARAAAAAGTIFTLSTLATTRPRDLAAAAPDTLRWQQLYVFRDRAITRALVDEALDSGFTAVVLTVDTAQRGHRERDLRSGYVIPPEIDVPAVSAALGRRDALSPYEMVALTDMAITWADVAELAGELRVPLVVKGVMTAEDAVLAAEHGAAAVVVSNHGGRQLDGVPATIDVLEEVVDAVGDRIEVLVDGGVRRGIDVLVALALGARAVLVGRPTLWGLAVGGEAGATRVLELLRAEIANGLALLGAPSPQAVTRAHVRP